MDLSPFLDPQFDHKQWINEVLAATTGDNNVEQQASELVLQLQAQMKEVMQSIERSCQEAVHCVPRLLREVDTLKVDAIALGNELAAMRDNISQVDSTGEQIITQLAELDRARRNAHAAANALRETDRWSSLVLGIGELLEAGEMDQVCCNIEGMEQCLTALTHLPDYKDRVQLVAQHKNSLESLVAPQLIRALGETVPGPAPLPADASPRWPSGASLEAKHLVSLLYRIGREGAAINYYTNWIKSCVLSTWEQCCSSNPSLDPVSDTYRFFTLLTNPSPSPKDPFCAQLDTDGSSPAGEQIVLTVFYAQLLNLINNQLATHLFPDSQSMKVTGAFTEALKDLAEKRRILVMGSAPQSKSPQVDYVANLLMITLNCCAQFGRVIESQVPGIFAETCSIPDAERKGVQEMALQLCRTLLDPFGNFGELFGKETRGVFEAELSKVNLTDARATPEFVERLSQTLAAAIQLINTTIRRCFDISMGIGIPYLLSIIQNFLDSFLAKWTIAVERSAEPFIAADSKSGFSQNSGLTCALHLASLTGELSLQSHSFVEAVLTKSADLFARILSDTESSPFLSAGEFPRESLWQSTQSFTSADWILLRLLVECHPAAYQNTVRLLAHPSTVSKPVDPVQDGSGNVGMQATLSGLHRSNVTACRAAVSLVRRVALAPISQVLNTVPTMPVWSFMPGSGEAKFPDLAYLPQDYITQIGQYLLALPEHLEPYMSEIGTDAESEQHISGRGLAECLHLGDPDAASMSLLTNKSPGPQEEAGDSSKLTPRRRLASLSLSGGHKSQQGERSVETFTSAAFCWLESFVSGAVCELLLTTWLRIGGSLPSKEQSQKKKKRPTSSGHRTKPDISDSESELEDHVHLTEHGAKQLTVDLDYLQNLLEDMGLSFPGNLQALRELISCSPNEFAELSADRPPRIVSALERLRGL